MSKQKLTKADLKRMEQLSAKMAEDKKQVALEKQKNKKAKKEIEAEKKKLAGQWKELKNAKKQAQNDKNFKAGVAAKEAKKSSKGGGGGNVKKLQEQLLEMKTKFNHEGKRARQFKQQVDQLTAENKVLQKKLKNLQGRKEKGEDPRIKNLLRENKQLKKQIKLLMIELNKKRRWFQRCIKSFKSSRQKWVRKQEEALKKKGYLIKYVFLDDVKRIQGYKEKANGKKGGKGKNKYKTRVKIKSRDGGVIVLKDVEFVVLDNDDDDDESGGGKGGKGKKGKKGKKSKGDALDEMEDYIAELEKEFGMDQAALGGNDDAKELESDDDFDFDDDEAGDLDGDYTMDQLAVDSAADPIDGDDDTEDGGSKAGGKSPGGKSGGKSPSGSSSGGKSPKPSGNGGRKSSKKDYLGLPVQPSIDAGDNAALQAQLVYLKKELDDRTDDVEKLKEIMSDGEKYPDPKGEVANYILQINKRGDELVDKLDTELHADKDDIEQMKGNNDRWQLWLNKFAGGFAKNGALFNQLLEVYEYYLKELKGRVDDLTIVNNAYYVDKNNDEKPKEEEEEQEETNENEDGGDGDGDDNADENTEENKEDEAEANNDDDGDDFGKLKKTVGDRHVDVEGQFKTIQEKQDADAEEEEKNKEEDYGAGDKEQEALDANSEKVKEIRDNLVSNNSSWRELIDIVSTDYDAATSEKGKLVSGLNEATTEFKALLDLVQKIPKRKIMDNNNNNEDKNEDEYGGDDNNENENENEEEEAAAGGD